MFFLKILKNIFKMLAKKLYETTITVFLKEKLNNINVLIEI